MAQTHYYYAINRKAGERVFDLTWNKFLDKYGWNRRRSQWPNIGGYFEFALDKPELDEPTPEELAPILRRTIRETLRHMTPEYFCMLLLGQQLGKRSFIRADIDAENLESDLDALNICAISAFLSGDIDACTLWCVLTIHRGWWSSDFFGLGKVERRRINTAIRQFGPYRPRPLFDWQPASAVRDGYTVLFEEDTRRFAQFIRLAWRQNRVVYMRDSGLVRFRSFELARRLHRACPAFLGNCLVYYWGE